MDCVATLINNSHSILTASVGKYSKSNVMHRSFRQQSLSHKHRDGILTTANSQSQTPAKLFSRLIANSQVLGMSQPRASHQQAILRPQHDVELSYEHSIPLINSSTLIGRIGSNDYVKTAENVVDLRQ